MGPDAVEERWTVAVAAMRPRPAIAFLQASSYALEGRIRVENNRVETRKNSVAGVREA
jgi:hypothetical protein